MPATAPRTVAVAFPSVDAGAGAGRLRRARVAVARAAVFLRAVGVDAAFRAALFFFGAVFLAAASFAVVFFCFFFAPDVRAAVFLRAAGPFADFAFVARAVFGVARRFPAALRICFVATMNLRERQPCTRDARLTAELLASPPLSKASRHVACGMVALMRWARLAVLLLLLPLLSACGDDGSEAREPEREARAVPVAAVELAPTDLSLTLELTGSIEPIREIRVAARMTGILSTLAVEEGRRVSSGAILARFDVAEPEAELRRARTLLRNAEATHRRAGELHQRELISDVDFEQARADMQVAQSEVQLWETRVALGTVRAPAAGVITQKFVERGDAVTSGAPLFVIADVSTLVVRVGVSDADAAILSPKQAVRITVDAMPGQTWDGTIRRIFPSADPETGLHPIEFALVAPAGGERPSPGYLARISVEADRRPDVLAVPNQALIASDTGQAVMAIEDGRTVRRPVVTGMSRQDWTEIVDGLSAGDVVVASNPASLREGTRVEVTARTTRPAQRTP
jgi:membrane fusion protein, multidrug efflux system